MTLYDLVDGWLESEHCPANYPGTYTHEEYCKGLRDYAKESDFELAEADVQLAVGIYEKYCATAKREYIPWEEYDEADKLRDIPFFTVAELKREQEQTDNLLKEMKQEGIRILTQEEAQAFFDSNSNDVRGRYNPEITRALVLDKGKDGKWTYIAIDNSTSDAWTEEFTTIQAAKKWLDGASLEEANAFELVQTKNTHGEKSLEELSNEPIQGETNIGGVRVIVDPRLKDVTYNEAVNYIDYCDKHKSNKGDRVTEIVLKPESGDNISIDWTVKPLPFTRIRRITGYLVGDLDRWNNAKKAEMRDRVKHTNTMGR